MRFLHLPHLKASVDASFFWPRTASSVACSRILVLSARRASDASSSGDSSNSTPGQQGLPLVQFWAQRKRFMWDSGCIRGCIWGVLGCFGVTGVARVYFVSETAQVELKGGRV